MKKVRFCRVCGKRMIDQGIKKLSIYDKNLNVIGQMPKHVFTCKPCLRKGSRYCFLLEDL